MMDKRWEIRNPDPGIISRLSRSLPCHPVTARVLANRSLSGPQQARAFIQAPLAALRPPFTLQDVEPAAARIAAAVEDREKILVFGDYDVDGITATAIVTDFLEAAGADVSFYIPHRVAEGYGLQPEHVHRYVHPGGISLVITVDCGSASHRSVQAAGDLGIDVLVTDHHNIDANLPPAVAVVNPKRSDCTAGMQDLAGVGVSFFLLIALRKKLRERDFWRRRPEPNLKAYCDLVALGTIADMVPLVGENRILAKTGLDLMADSRRPGLEALCHVCGIGANMVGGEEVAFRLAPRLNAAGRLDHAAPAVELLKTRDAAAAESIARRLDELNRKRQVLENQVLEQVRTRLRAQPALLDHRTLVFAHAGWHQGVLGIAASRLVKVYGRPTVLLAVGDRHAKGSARSVDGIDLYRVLADCRDCLAAFGGHAMAAGLKIEREQLRAFRERFERCVRDRAGDDIREAAVLIDAEVDLADVSATLLDELESLAPFGVGNPEPLFMARNVAVVSSRPVGSGHRKMRLRAAEGPRTDAIDAIHFNPDPAAAGRDHFERIAFRLRWNRWNGRKRPQIIVEDV